MASLLSSLKTSSTVRGAVIALCAWFAEAAVKRLVGMSEFELTDTARAILYTTLEALQVAGLAMFAMGARKALGLAPTMTVTVPGAAQPGETQAPTTVKVEPSPAQHAAPSSHAAQVVSVTPAVPPETAPTVTTTPPAVKPTIKKRVYPTCRPVTEPPPKGRRR